MREKLKEGCHDAQVLEANKFSIQFEEDEITLSIPECEEIEGWEISCLHHPIIVSCKNSRNDSHKCLNICFHNTDHKGSSRCWQCTRMSVLHSLDETTATRTF